MKMSIRWIDIKQFNNSQNNAFEELVCQLARAEHIDGKKELYRVAAPDGGVEAYCVLENGEEYGWQAKYFSTMGDSQWRQLKDSFETALKTHPKLTKYFICIPLDRQDPRQPDKEWFMDRWKKKVEEWTTYARTQNREVAFEYWGSSELIDRLSLEKHAGRKLFWFSQEDFSDKWFAQQVKTNIENLGKRYTPELNIELELADNFAALSRNERFRKILQEKFHEVAVQINKALDSMPRIGFEGQIGLAKAALDQIIHWALLSQQEEFLAIDTAALKEQVRVIEGVLSEYRSYLDKIESKKRLQESHEHQSRLYEIYEAQHAVSNFIDFIQSQILELANNPALLLVGSAGIGKSHLLADIALQRIKSGKACILLLGQHFCTEEAPWTQILQNLLRLGCNEREILGALNAKAEAQRERLLFIIDAVNEGRGRYFWPDHIRGFINEFSKYPWLGLVLSIRDSYEALIVPNEFLKENKLVKIVHSGFKGFEYQASSFFFAQHGIAMPRVPLLHPEFSNPLFLKLFCEGLSRSGLHQIPEGYNGITRIIDFFLESIDKKLAQPAHFDYPEGRKMIRKVIDGLIEHKLKNDLGAVPYEDAYDIEDRILSKFSSKRRFLDALISEGVLSKNLFWKEKGEYEEGVYLAYERFEDHLTASYLLDKYLASDTQESIFKQGGVLFKYIEEAFYKRGILDAFSIQVPERTEKEFYELIDKEKEGDDDVVESFIYSLLWRKPESIQDKTNEYINKYILTYQGTFDSFFQMVYAVSADPSHLYNADRLHNFLMQLSLADRDGLWTIYLHNQDHQESAMSRLIDWARSEEDKYYLSDASRLLAAKALAWLFTSTNIPFRDAATKALVVLLENNIQIIIELLKAFKDVNDHYVVERIFAAAYGAVLRSEQLAGIAELSEYIIESLFKEEEVYPNILVRDYARNIVEYAHYKGCLNVADLEIIRPPYMSSFPETFPTNEEIDAYEFDYQSETFKDYFWSQNRILHSMVTEYGRGVGSYGDFGRYEFQSAVHDWDNFDPNDLSNYACKLIFEKYGYDVEKHGEFDRNVRSQERDDNIQERIGKKYQWIALYEVLARLADNHQTVDPSTEGKDSQKYMWCQGPWEPFVRNIDPTVVHSRQEAEKKSKRKIYRPKYSDWEDTNQNWIVSDKILPKPAYAISDDDDWLTLEAHLSWNEPVLIGQDKYDHPRKQLWYQVRSYFVRDEEAEDLINWLKKQHFMGRWFPEGPSQEYRIFSREYYWSPAYRFFANNSYYGGNSWEKVVDRKNKELTTAKVLPTSEGYNWESGLKDNRMAFLAPREIMFTGMGMQFSRNLGEWNREDGKIACYYTFSEKEGRSALVIKKELIQQFLSENKLQIFWTCLGEKMIIGGYLMNERFSRRLELSGIYTLRNGQIEGEMKTIKPGDDICSDN